ncbi:Z1 domain-containing protein [Brevundimonas sp.]|uniref:Z1 domain-containing protein n=1 Tax=Brevundimonas sp. TaxID=1871086 RepID=UPI003BAB5E30
MSQPTTILIAPNTVEGRLWNPVAGIEATSLLERKHFDDAAQQKVLEENLEIIARCLPPTAVAEQRTGLVIGYVQSGKTLSFTMVTALARDNGYRLVIVLAGTKTNLLDQNDERLKGDLGILGERGKFWRTLVNPRPEATEKESVKSALALWDRFPQKERCRTLMIVVMKNASRLDDLRALLAACDLSKTSAILIDDEGDQAGLNTKHRQNDESATYAAILNLRSVIPSHTYLQYTATPQAPLLISRIDALSPEFQRLLEPGAGYVGGQHLFKRNSPYISTIPAAELPGAHDPNDGPPASLECAMRTFFLGVAAGVIEGREGNRTMMVHPSHLTSMHEAYATWARSVKQNWETVLRDEGSPDQRDLRRDFKASYEDLVKTAELPPFEDLWGELSYALEDTMVRVVNASRGRIPKFPWSDSYAFILVGGAGLDRGFTVEGLTVTYMPRGAGTGTADTIQQRARFFGYKRGYVGLIRIFVDAAVSDAFTAYVEHEDSVRGALAAHGDRPLSEWRRLFFLDSSLRPTRRSVMALDTMRGRAKDWVWNRYPGPSPKDNTAVVDAFLAKIDGRLTDDPEAIEHGWTGVQRHKVAKALSLDEIYEELLVPLRLDDEDDVFDYTLMLLQIRAALDARESGQLPLLGDVYVMSGGDRRERAIRADGAIENTFQGANPKSTYPGDRELKTKQRFTIQVHRLKLKTQGQPAVDVVAVNVPDRYRRDGVFQPED